MMLVIQYRQLNKISSHFIDVSSMKGWLVCWVEVNGRQTSFSKINCIANKSLKSIFFWHTNFIEAFHISISFSYGHGVRKTCLERA